MEKIFSLVIGFLSLIQIGYSQIGIKVDERFELTSITFALAGVPEYCEGGVPSYWKDLDELTPYELTEPINFVRELNQVHRIGYNAVPSAASLLEIKNGKIRLQPQYDISKITELDSRWTPELYEKYIKMLNIFYKESNFHKWFEKHRELYDVAEKRFNEHIANTATEWFRSFFGKSLDANINLYISLVNGPSNYAFDGGILLGVMSDSEGVPSANSETMDLLIHELGHHYTNPLFDKYWEQMEGSANKIYPYVKEQMYRAAYGSARTTMCEWLNNLFVYMYMKEHNSKNLSINLYLSMNKGFIWMQRSVDFIENFYAHRDLYPTIEEFMPQIVAFLNYTAENFDLVQREFDQREAYITNIYPAPGSDITNFTEIVITFSEKMNGSYGFRGFPEGTIPPPLEKVKWSDDLMSVTLLLTPNKMEKGKAYGLILDGGSFQTAKHFPLKQEATSIIFKIGN